MAFWNESGTEPLRQFKFLLTISGIESWVVKKVDRPSFKVGETTHTFLDKKFYFPGKVEWNDVKATIAEPVAPSQTRILYGILQRTGYTAPTTGGYQYLNNLSTVGKLPAIITFDIKLLDSNGTAVETWSLKNAWIKDVTFTGLDYEQEGANSIDMTVRYDWAEFT